MLAQNESSWSSLPKNYRPGKMGVPDTMLAIPMPADIMHPETSRSNVVEPATAAFLESPNRDWRDAMTFSVWGTTASASMKRTGFSRELTA